MLLSQALSKKPSAYLPLLERFQREHREGLWTDQDLCRMQAKLDSIDSKKTAWTAWQRVQISRHPDRPRASALIQALCPDFEEFFGDRLYRDDSAVICGFATIGETKTVVVAQEKGSDLESRMARNFGMMHPEGYRKALRFMELAEKFQLPVLCLIDTPGAYPGLESEQRGIAGAIAQNLKMMARLRTPIVAVVLSEGCSGGALGIGLSDVTAMLENAYYSVISPEGCASILWKDTDKKEEAAKALKFTAEALLLQGIIDEILQEPALGFHHGVEEVLVEFKEFYSRWIGHLQRIDRESLLRRRYAKYRSLGVFEKRETVLCSTKSEGIL